MGTKGDKLTNVSVARAEFLVSALTSLGEIRAKKMFGGNGVFCNDKMFVMVDSKGKCFLKVNDQIADEFALEGSVKHSKMPYSSIPEKVLENQSLLMTWAKKSLSLLA